MFKSDYKKLRLSFNEFHGVDEAPEYDEFCFLELKDGSHTAGKWMPFNCEPGKAPNGEFIRGMADAISLNEVTKWHSLDRYDLTNSLENERVNYINLGEKKEDVHKVKMENFKSLSDGDLPKNEQYCLLILKNGRLAAGRWNQWRGKNEGTFIYASALASHGMDETWAWTALSLDRIFAMEEERENEKKREEELNRNPSVDQDKFKYGTDIKVYYKKALEKLQKEYPWATLAQMKRTPWEIVPLHGRYVFGQVSEFYPGTRNVKEWTEGCSADEFIDFLCEYAKESVKNSNPDKKFKYGMDIDTYLEKAYANVKKEYRWLDKSMLGKHSHYEIKKVDGDYEFVKVYGRKKNDYSVCDCRCAEDFVERVESDYQSEAMASNPVVAEYNVPFGPVDIRGWGLEKYVFSKLQTGDYKVYVQAGDRTTGAGREFFITPYCFEAESYEEFLNRYQEIVPGGSFGLFKEDLLPNEELKSFLGY